MKVCYFIQAHKNPDQVYRLVKTIKSSSPSAQVLIGYDFTNSYLDMAPLQGLSDVNLIRGDFPVRRAEFSALQPYLNAVNWLFDQESDFDWLAYISGQDYPVQPLSQVEKFLSETDYDGFIQYFNVFSNESLWNVEQGLKRYFYQYISLPKSTTGLFKKLKRFKKYTKFQFDFWNGVRIGMPASQPPFNRDFICYGGNHRHFLSRKCIMFLRKFIADNPAFVNYYKKAFHPEESFVQTILANNNKFNLCNDHKIYDDFRNTTDGHPKILTVEDYPKMTNSQYLFARKFEQDSKILDKLDSVIFANNLAK